MRSLYKEVQTSEHLYDSQTLFDMLMDAKVDEESEAVEKHMQAHGVFDGIYPEYMDVCDFIHEQQGEEIEYDEERERWLQYRIDTYYSRR